MPEFNPPIQRYEERWKDWAERDPDLVRLRNRLLKEGGEEVVPNKEPDLEILLNQGHVIQPIEVLNYNMQDSQCHRNARALYLDDASVTDIGTGWALSDDGLWRQHSWAMRGDEIVETTQDRVLYYGIILEGDELERFIKMNV